MANGPFFIDFQEGKMLVSMVDWAEALDPDFPQQVADAWQFFFFFLPPCCQRCPDFLELTFSGIPM